MSRKFTALVFDEILPATATLTTYYTSAEMNDRLGAPDFLALQAVVD